MQPVSPSSEAVAASDSEAPQAESTNLALGRTYLASERTLMGWIRTALSMISFGFTLGKAGQVIDHAQIKGLLRVHTFSIEGLAGLLVVLGTLALGVATVEHRRRTRLLRVAGLAHQRSLGLVVAIVLTALGAFAFTALVTAL